MADNLETPSKPPGRFLYLFSIFDNVRGILFRHLQDASLPSSADSCFVSCFSFLAKPDGAGKSGGEAETPPTSDIKHNHFRYFLAVCGKIHSLSWPIFFFLLFVFRCSPKVLDRVVVDCYGAETPLNQVASVKTTR